MPQIVRAYNLPPEPFIERYLEWEGRQRYNADDERSMGGTALRANPWDVISPRDLTAMKMGVSRAWIDRLVRGKYSYIHFDRADSLLCALHQFDAWWHDPVLRELYYGVNLRLLDEARPTHQRRRSGGPQRQVNYLRIKELYEAGVPRSEIMEQTGATKAQMDHAVKIHNLNDWKIQGQNSLRTFDWAEALRLHEEENLTWVEVADRLGVKVTTVRKAMERVRRGEHPLIPQAA